MNKSALKLMRIVGVFSGSNAELRSLSGFESGDLRLGSIVHRLACPLPNIVVAVAEFLAAWFPDHSSYTSSRSAFDPFRRSVAQS